MLANGKMTHQQDLGNGKMARYWEIELSSIRLEENVLEDMTITCQTGLGLSILLMINKKARSMERRRIYYSKLIATES